LTFLSSAHLFGPAAAHSSLIKRHSTSLNQLLRVLHLSFRIIVVHPPFSKTVKAQFCGASASSTSRSSNIEAHSGILEDEKEERGSPYFGSHKVCPELSFHC